LERKIGGKNKIDASLLRSCILLQHKRPFGAIMHPGDRAK